MPNQNTKKTITWDWHLTPTSLNGIFNHACNCKHTFYVIFFSVRNYYTDSIMTVFKHIIISCTVIITTLEFCNTLYLSLYCMLSYTTLKGKFVIFLLYHVTMWFSPSYLVFQLSECWVVVIHGSECDWW